jgi:hypothetical protein
MIVFSLVEQGPHSWMGYLYITLYDREKYENVL